MPSQSAKFWAKEKDRYLRQLLISDIEAETGREFVVYYSQLNEGISLTDADDLSEILDGIGSKSVDIMLNTPGGAVDAVEKMISVLKNRCSSYRVVVPSLAKSGGTVIAISADEILFGVNSELGPIDPQMFIPNIGMVPCEFVERDDTMPPIVRSIAGVNVKRMRDMAKKILSEGMLKAVQEEQVQKVIEKISSSTTYASHGAVIDFNEAKSLGLKVTWLEDASPLWRKIWLLFCLYDHDTKVKGYGKIFEGANNSLARLAQNQH